MQSRWRISIATRITVVVSCLIVVTVGLFFSLNMLLSNQRIWSASITLLVMLPIAALLIYRQFEPILAMFRTLGGTTANYRDGDFSFGLHWSNNDELGDLIKAHNELGDVLREQRLGLIQRELLLDAMVQNTPVAMLLTADSDAIVFANVAARQLLHHGRRLEGHHLKEILQTSAPSLREALARGGDSLFTVSQLDTSIHNTANQEDETYHLARRHFTLNGRRHELLLLRHLTVELRRQEVQTWKKVIRVISHELNNSLAPVASLARSSIELVQRGQHDRLPEVLSTIADRTQHLENFISGYAQFAKLPVPRKELTTWAQFVRDLHTQIAFTQMGVLPDVSVNIDIAQMEQALMNLLKNAHESGSTSADISLAIRTIQDMHLIEVSDRGGGMTDTVMSNALVPFYSTKRAGTGLGLALAREIIEAHGGRITISNRESGGLTVALFLPV